MNNWKRKTKLILKLNRKLKLTLNPKTYFPPSIALPLFVLELSIDSSPFDRLGIVGGGDEGQLWWCAGKMIMLDGAVAGVVVVKARERWVRDRENR